MSGTWLAWDGGLALLAPVVAIGVALATHRVVAALLAGLAVAAVVASEGDVVAATGVAVGRLVGAVADADHLKISGFTALVGAMVGVMTRGPLMAELVGLVTARVRGARRAMGATWLAGLLVFFDDYANCLVVGSAMGPVCDREGVSRAKLAYLVDSTAAPVASLAVVGTWVGYEVGLIDEALAGTARAGEGFALFLTALPFRYYGWFALALCLLVAWTGRDIGPMIAAEAAARRARRDGPVLPQIQGRLRALAPPVVLVAVTLAWVVWTGVSALDQPVAQAPLYALLRDSDPFTAMVWGASAGLAVASVVSWRAGMTTGDWVEGVREGVGSVVSALVVLFLAWALGAAIGDTAARDVLTAALSGRLDPAWLPVTTFLVAGATAFSTGTSFGTMSILIPLAVPLALDLAPADAAILAATTAAVLGGACFGDHASPISDTTVLSAAGAGVDVVTHVRTQLPYALLAGGVAASVGHLATGHGGQPLWLVPAGIVVLFAVLRGLGTRPEDYVRSNAPLASDAQ